jgi:hypothetical protein
MWIRLKTWKLFNPYCVDWKILPPVLFWFQLAQWFQRRRLKCNSLQMTKRLPTTDAKWWQYLTWHLNLFDTYCNYHVTQFQYRITWLFFDHMIYWIYAFQGKMVLHLSKEPSARLLKHVVRCYLRLSDNPR